MAVVYHRTLICQTLAHECIVFVLLLKKDQLTIQQFCQVRKIMSEDSQF